MMETKLPKQNNTVAIDGVRHNIGHLHNARAEIALIRAKQKIDTDMPVCTAMTDPIVDKAMAQIFGVSHEI